MRRLLFFLVVFLAAAPATARDSLGVFGQWGAFHDAEVPRCYAISAALTRQSDGGTQAFASVGTWPERQVRGQVHFRLSRALADDGEIMLRMGSEEFALTGDARDAWAANTQMDARIIAAMRAASEMAISATDNAGRRFTDRYSLDGAATAVDAARVGCTQL